MTYLPEPRDAHRCCLIAETGLCAADPLVANLRSGARPLELRRRASRRGHTFATPNFPPPCDVRGMVRGQGL